MGKRADLVLLEADPLLDIGNLRHVAAVALRGRYLDAGELRRLMRGLTPVDTGTIRLVAPPPDSVRPPS